MLSLLKLQHFNLLERYSLNRQLTEELATSLDAMPPMVPTPLKTSLFQDRTSSMSEYRMLSEQIQNSGSLEHLFISEQKRDLLRHMAK